MTELPQESSSQRLGEVGADIAISVQNISKVYRLYDKPQDRLKQAMLWRFGRSYGQDFRALSQVSFDVRRGEAMAIIGQNGSGKSTLLQIIAGTLQASSGTVCVHGRVAALLELGSGFNPEYSGRENVFLSGSILGLSKATMAAKFEAIASFADIGAFIEQPVKLYSSGMMVRLAFAVQAHLDPEVLIVDEALAVGDVYFQHKCMRLLKQRLDSGLTLLFVSHDTETVKRFCRTAIWLDRGEAKYLGNAGAAAERYLAFMRMRDTEPIAPEADVAQPEHEVTSGTLENLIEIQHEIDVRDPRLIIRGRWSTRETTTGVIALETTDSESLVAFRFCGTSLELVFERSPSAGMARVVIDDTPRIVDCHGLERDGQERTTFSLKPGWHSVTIGPSPKSAIDADSGELIWRGGRVIDAVALEAIQDHTLAGYSGEVPAYGNGKARITSVELLDFRTLEPIADAHVGQRVRLRLHARRLEATGPRLEFSFIVRDKNRIDLFGTTTIDQGIRLDPTATSFSVEFAFTIRLGPGSYSILAAFVECSEDLTQRVPMEQIDIAAVFRVLFNQERPVWYLFEEPVVTQAATSFD